MKPTKQQQNVIDTVHTGTSNLIKVQAVAGAGKTATLLELVKTIKPDKALYLVYNKALQKEADAKFKGLNVECRTIHSLAYKYVVSNYHLKVGFYNIRDVIGKDLSYKQQKAIHTAIEAFCLSKYLDVEEFLETIPNLGDRAADIFRENLDALADGTIQCSHSFYLKLFHIYLSSGDIELPEYDIILVDEAGDITELTLEVFKLLKAKKKVVVGDRHQSIYGFNNTINAFEALKDEGVEANLTQSFRVSDKIAPLIESFMRSTLYPEFEFKGRHYTKSVPIETRAYISRNNSGLLPAMFNLMEENIAFNTTRPIETMLEVPLMLANLNSTTPITDYKLRHIEELRKKYYKSTYAQSKGSIHQFIARALKDDTEIQAAVKVLNTHGKDDLKELVMFVKLNSKIKCELTLSTSHSVKGLEYHQVEIAQDLNMATTKAIETIKTLSDSRYLTMKQKIALAEAKETIRLYYVATSRAMIKIVNAEHLKEDKWNY